MDCLHFTKVCGIDYKILKSKHINANCIDKHLIIPDAFQVKSSTGKVWMDGQVHAGEICLDGLKGDWDMRILLLLIDFISPCGGWLLGVEGRWCNSYFWFNIRSVE